MVLEQQKAWLPSPRDQSRSRSKARALAHRAAVDSKVIPGEGIGASRSFRCRRPKHQHERLWYCVRLSHCRVGKSPQYSGPSEPVVLIEAPQAKGETPPQDRGKHRPQYAEEIPTTSGETSPQDMGKKRPKLLTARAKAQRRHEQSRVRFSPKTNVRWGPHEVLASSSTTPWQRFLCHVACILTWLRYQGYTLLDLAETNMGITLDSVASPQPAVRFFDVLSWRKEQRTDGKWTGFHKLAVKVCPTHSRWLKTAVAHSGGDPNRVFRQVAAVESGAMANGSMSLEKVA